MHNKDTQFINKYVHLFEKAEQFGFSAKDFIFNPEKLKHDNIKKKRKRKFILFVLFILAIFISIFINYFDKFLIIVSSNYYENVQCILPSTTLLSNLFLPPIDCSFCQTSTGKIKRIKMVDKDVFEEKYAYSGTPVVITDATLNWKALSEFNIDFFFNLYSNDSFTDDCQFFPYETNYSSLSEALHPDNYPNSTMAKQSWYIGWGNCNKTVTDILRKYYAHPYFLPDQSESSSIDWIFIGYPGYGAPSHLDSVGQASWQAQIKGSKLWRLEAPSECYFECYGAGKEVILKEGEILVVDTNLWYHSTEIIGDGISISIGSEYD